MHALPNSHWDLQKCFPIEISHDSLEAVYIYSISFMKVNFMPPFEARKWMLIEFQVCVEYLVDGYRMTLLQWSLMCFLWKLNVASLFLFMINSEELKHDPFLLCKNENLLTPGELHWVETRVRAHSFATTNKQLMYLDAGIKWRRPCGFVSSLN